VSFQVLRIDRDRPLKLFDAVIELAAIGVQQPKVVVHLRAPAVLPEKRTIVSAVSLAFCTVAILPCSPSALRKRDRSVTRKPVSDRRAGTAEADAGGPAVAAATALQSSPVAFSSFNSTSMIRASSSTCRCTRSCTASK